MKIEQFLWKYLHSLVALAIGMFVLFISLHFIATRGPNFLKSPAQRVGGAIGGQAYGF